ncbi:hypothetical protein [Lentibacillus jeotgali]|uniref:hypothetical protein n=1 Tax=Lentibacillus jeotgali TaxID=558169 RepID=UPI000262603D|nr:hypothetical protein [Lentibacillus jeotgali]
MNRYQIYYLVGIGLLMAGALILAFLLYNPSEQSNSLNEYRNGDNGQEIYWGVDSVSYTMWQ